MKNFKNIIKVAGNSYFIHGRLSIGVYLNPTSKKATLIDSGLEKSSLTKLESELQQAGYSIGAVINTHHHADHCGGNAYLQNKYGANLKIFATKIESHIIDSPELEPMYFCSGAHPIKELTPKFYQAGHSTVTDIIQNKDQEIFIDGQSFQIISLPGHTPGMIAVISPDNVFYSGDSIFNEDTINKHIVLFYTNIALTLKSFLRILQLKTDHQVLYHGGLLKIPLNQLIDKHLEKLNLVSSFIYDQIKQNSAFNIDNLVAAVTRKFLTPKEFKDGSAHSSPQVSQYFLTRTCVMGYLAYFQQENLLNFAINNGDLLITLDLQKKFSGLSLPKVEEIKSQSFRLLDKEKKTSETPRSISSFFIDSNLQRKINSLPEIKQGKILSRSLTYDFGQKKTVYPETLKSYKSKKITFFNEMKTQGKGIYNNLIPIPGMDQIIASYDNQIVILSSKNGSVKPMFESEVGHNNFISAMAIREEKFLVSASYDTNIRVWNVSSNKCMTVLTGHSDVVWQVDFLDDSTIVSCSSDGTVKKWNILEEKCQWTSIATPGGLFSLAIFNLDKVLVGGANGCVYILNNSKLDLFMQLPEKNHIRALCATEQELIVGTDGGAIYICSLETRQILKTLLGHTNGILSLKLQNNRLISASHDETIKIWNISSEQCKYTINCEFTPFQAIQYENDIFSVGDRNKIACWSLADTNDSELNLKLVRVALKYTKVSFTENPYRIELDSEARIYISRIINFINLLVPAKSINYEFKENKLIIVGDFEILSEMVKTLKKISESSSPAVSGIFSSQQASSIPDSSFTMAFTS